MVPLKTFNNMQICLLEKDKDQEKGFIQIVAASVVRLHKKADNNNIVSKRFSNGKRKFDFSKPLNIWVKDGQTNHIATLTDAKILARLK